MSSSRGVLLSLLQRNVLEPCVTLMIGNFSRWEEGEGQLEPCCPDEACPQDFLLRSTMVCHHRSYQRIYRNTVHGGEHRAIA